MMIGCGKGGIGRYVTGWGSDPWVVDAVVRHRWIGVWVMRGVVMGVIGT